MSLTNQPLSPGAQYGYMHDFSDAYLMAHQAYALTTLQNNGTFDSSIPVTLHNPKQLASSYQVTPILDMPSGLHGYILTETTSSSDRTNIKICFRGVQLSEPCSVLRALEFPGPGVNSFIDSSSSIFKQIEVITKQYSAVNLDFTGHSLGGADATYCFPLYRTKLVG